MTKGSAGSGSHSQKLRDFLERQGLNKRAQADLISQILELSASQAYRKLSAGDGAWLLPQLDKIAAHFSITTAELLYDESGQIEFPNSNSQSPLVEATLHLAKDVACKIQIGEPLAPDFDLPPLVAVKVGEQWHVYQDSPAEVDGYYAVRSISALLPDPANRHAMPRVAVIDDVDADLQAAVLEQHGLRATAYGNPADFLLAVEREHYDAYVLDWVLGSSDSASIIDIIRSIYGDSLPIIVLTGFAQEYEGSLSKALQNKNVHYVGKPAPGSILAMQIKNALANSGKKPDGVAANAKN